MTGSRPWATSESWWEVTLEAVSAPDLYLTSVYDVDADSRGRVFLVDWPAGGITVLTPDLAYLQTVGREGEGPGEFIAKEVQILPGDTLLVYDSALGRMTLFDPDNLEVVATRPPPNRERDVVYHLWKIPEPGRYFALDRAPYTAGEGEAADQGRMQVILAFDESAETIADTLAIIADSERLVMRREGYLSVESIHSAVSRSSRPSAGTGSRMPTRERSTSRFSISGEPRLTPSPIRQPRSP